VILLFVCDISESVGKEVEKSKNGGNGGKKPKSRVREGVIGKVRFFASIASIE
jgi:hypothetical protein